MCSEETKVLEEFECLTRRAKQAQLDTLLRILKCNAPTVQYLQPFRLMDDDDDDAIVKKFKQRVPIVEHKDLEPFILRIADGDTSPLLSADPIHSFALSSGTSGGKSKLVPKSAAAQNASLFFFQVAEILRRRSFPPSVCKEEAEEEMMLGFYYAGKQMRSKGGFDVGSGTTLYFHSKAFRDRSRDSPLGMPFSSPDEVILAQVPCEQAYCHLLCGLCYASRITLLAALFAFSLVEAFRLLEKVWREICHDIRTGTLSPRITDPSLREAIIERVLKVPNPSLADHLEAILAESANNNWKNIIPNLFPRIRYVQSVLSGAMLGYVPSLRNYAGCVPLVCLDYMSSEGLLGINVEPESAAEETSFVLTTTTIYFEFIPVQEQHIIEDEGAEVVDISGLKEGGTYELVLTTMAGLYRYRIGDVVRVKGFYNEAPKVSYVGRSKGGALSICTEKTDEQEIQMASESASKLLEGTKMRVQDFSSYVDMSSKPGHYVIFWEMVQEEQECSSKRKLLGEMMQKCCNCLDACLNEVYHRHRNSGAIGGLELCVVKEGSFGEIAKMFTESNGTNIGQFKIVRCIVGGGEGSLKVLNLLRSNTIHSFRAT